MRIDLPFAALVDLESLSEICLIAETPSACRRRRGCRRKTTTRHLVMKMADICGGIYRIFSHLAPALFKFPLIKPIRHIVICNLSEIGSWNLENLEISLRIHSTRVLSICHHVLRKCCSTKPVRGYRIQIQIFRVASPQWLLDLIRNVPLNTAKPTLNLT